MLAGLPGYPATWRRTTPLLLFVSVLFCLTTPIQAQQNQCRTPPVGTSTAYCASEAFVTNSVPAPGQLPGTATNDNAAAGKVGEIIESTVLAGSAVSLTTNVQTTVTSISLTAGDWDVWGNIIYSAGGSTVTTLAIGAISTVAATLPTAPAGGGYGLWIGSVTGIAPGVIAGKRRISIASTTTVYLIAYTNFTTSTLAAYGYIGARRAR